MTFLSEKEKQYFINYFNLQIGQSYPCSNQYVICGIITNTQKQAINYMNKYPQYQLICKSYNQLVWKNSITNERWQWVPIASNIRGYRFYKIKISSNITKEDFYGKILPYCSFYCKNMEFI